MPDEFIAIIGLGCRFPKAKDLDSYWQLLSHGIDAISEVPSDRWNIDDFYDSDLESSGKMNTRWGGFLENIQEFDAEFFGITPREAERLDPQQRLLLEVSWEALENANLLPSSLSGSQTGVFVGISNSDYGRVLLKDFTNINAYNGTGSAFSVAANRISYFFNFKGPSVAIDTACSSSLVSLHYACHSLRNHESDLCLSGGVNAILSPELTINFSQAHMMAADGRCKTFDNLADGYVRGEGCGMVVLKRLTDALRDGDNIRAIIRGTAINQDGLTNGITAPNGPSQQAVIKQALKNAGVSPEQISYVETHGTGTPLGDPQEFKSLKTVLMKERGGDQPCWLGSVKTNIGHLESAAGVAGLIKVVLALQHREIPPHLHLKELNRYISLKGTSFDIPNVCQKWEINNHPRFAGISSFGFGGTNCHVIVEEAEANHQIQQQPSPKRPYHLLNLSAKNESALDELARQYVNYLEQNPQISLQELCHTANTRRSHLNYGITIVGKHTSEMKEKLLSFTAHEESENVLNITVKQKTKNKLVWMFTGQGSQYPNMGRQLYETESIFKTSFDQCSNILDEYLGESLLDILYCDQPDASRKLNQTAFTQPALFAIEYALSQLWQSWGIYPDVVMGHSVGEYVAACIAGIFSLEDGLKLIAHRGRLIQSLPQKGKMMATLIDEELLESLIQPFSDKIAIAAFNGSNNFVLSGDGDSIDQIFSAMQAKDIPAKFLEVSHAFHSPLMQPMLGEFKKITDEINYNQPKIDMISNVTGELSTEEISTSQYWLNHVVKPVKFRQSFQYLNQAGYKIFLEVGPKPILLGMGKTILDNDSSNQLDSILFLPSLRSGKEDSQQMLESLGRLSLSGASINWSSFSDNQPNSLLQIPTYPFQRQRHWLKSSPTGSLLNALKSEKLAERLREMGDFSEEEIQLVPKILDKLAQCEQQVSQSTPANAANQAELELTNNGNSIQQKPPRKILVDKKALLDAKPQQKLSLLKQYFGKVLTKISGLSVENIDWDQPLSALGIDSLMATELRKQFEIDLDESIPVEFLAGLSLNQFLQQIMTLLESHAAKESSQQSVDSKDVVDSKVWFPNINFTSPAPYRLFCLPYAGGGASIFKPWKQKLSSKIEVCPIQLPGRESRFSEPLFNKLKPLIDTLTPLIKPYLDRPYALLGYSFGAIVAFELARKLREKDLAEPFCLYAVACRAPQLPDLDLPMHTMADDQFIEALIKLQGIPEGILQDSELMELYLPVLRADFKIFETYFYSQGQPFNFPIKAFGGVEDTKVSQAQLESWSKQSTHSFSLKMIPGNHFFVDQLVAELQQEFKNFP